MSKWLNCQPVIDWARDYLCKHGYGVSAREPECVKNAPWSVVVRFDTDQGSIYLKHMPAVIAIEADVIAVLKNRFNANVPEVIAKNDDLHCFIMRDAGQPMRQVLKHQFDPEWLCSAAAQFAELQLTAVDNLGRFFEIGVPDWRLNRLPALYEAVVSDELLLRSEGFSGSDMSQLQQLTQHVTQWCDELANYPIQDSIVQPDFHDNNLLVNAGTLQVTWIDLGELIVSYPLFSLFTFLMQIKKHHGLLETDPVYKQIEQACYVPYQNRLADKEQFERVSELAGRLNWIYGIAYQQHFMHICGKQALIAVGQWKIEPLLKTVLKTLCD